MIKIKTLALTLILPIFAIAQEDITITSYKNFSYVYNEKTEEFEKGQTVYAKIEFTFHGKYISVNDKSNSIYRILEELPSKKYNDKEVAKAKCLDEQNKNCLFTIINYKDEKTNPNIIVTYSDLILYYIIE
jgi:hypothetical protein